MKPIYLAIMCAAMAFAQSVFPPTAKPACTASLTTNCAVNADSSGNVSVSATVTGRNTPISVRSHGALGDAVQVSCSMTAASATLTCPASTFSIAVLTKGVVVMGAGAAAAPLVTTISAYTSGTTVTLSAAASTTVASAITVFGTNDTTAITNAIAAASARELRFEPGDKYYVTPGTQLDFNAVAKVTANGATFYGMRAALTTSLEWAGGMFYDYGYAAIGGPLFYVPASHVSIHQVRANLTAAYCGVQVSAVGLVDVTVTDWNITYNNIDQCAITITAGDQIRIANGAMAGPVTGTNDDGIALFNTVGPITNVTISNITASNVYDVLKIYSSTAYLISDVVMSNITADRVLNPLYYQGSDSAGTVQNISASNITASDAAGARAQGILLFTPLAGTWRNLSVNTVRFRGRTNASPGNQNQAFRIIANANTTSINGLSLSNITWDDLYDGLATDGGHPGSPVAQFLYYQANTGGSDAVASNWTFDGISVNGVSGPLASTSASVSNFRWTNSYAKNLYTSNTGIVNLTAINDLTAFFPSDIVLVPVGGQLHGFDRPRIIDNSVPPVATTDSEAQGFNYRNAVNNSSHLSWWVGNRATETGRFTCGFGASAADGYCAISTYSSGLAQRFKFDGPGNFVMTGTTLANIVSTAGAMTWCSNCNVASPCTSGGSGAWAFVNAAGVKNCPF